MASHHIFRKPSTVWLTAAMAGVLALAHAAARADGPPLILDTQTGINDGQKGIVLQNAPLSREPMVVTRQLPALSGFETDSSQPYIVAPYIAVPGGGSRPYTPGSSRPPRPPHPQPKLAPQTPPTQ